jgi:hypothetical protein
MKNDIVEYIIKMHHTNPTLFVGCLPCNELEGVHGKRQKEVVHRVRETIT